MGRKDNRPPHKAGFKKNNATISKNKQQRGRRVKGATEGRKQFRSSAPQPAIRSRPEEARGKKNRGSEVRKSKKGNLGQFSHMVGKSLFKMVPEGQDEAHEDKFAALNGEQEQEEQDEYEEEVDEGEDGEQGEGSEEEAIQQEELEVGQQGEEDEHPDDENEFEGGAEEEEGNEEGQEEEMGENEPLKQEDQEQMPQLDQQQDDKNVDISVIGLKIQETLQVLMSLPKLGQGRPRKYFVDKLKSYIHRYYGYNYELIDHFLNFLNPAEMIQFFEANETQRPLTIRTNTLKTRRKELAQALIQRGVNLDPLAEWSKVGIKIYETKVPIGATPEYLAGHYMLQSASSFLPVLALDPQMNQKILDMASAPGGKTSYIAQIMKNTGAIFANDLKKDRLKALQFNIFRLGITNTVITCRDGRKYPEIFPNTFDRVLLDAPCTGLGIISKDHSIKSNRVLLDIYKNSHVQKQLLLAAIDCTKVGGVVVYSTCSVSPIENEEVINYALKKRHVKIVDIDDLVEVGDPGLTKFVDKRYQADLRKTKRIYPHVHNMDGFYLGKLVKVANGKKEIEKGEEEDE